MAVRPSAMPCDEPLGECRRTDDPAVRLGRCARVDRASSCREPDATDPATCALPHSFGRSSVRRPPDSGLRSISPRARPPEGCGCSTAGPGCVAGRLRPLILHPPSRRPVLQQGEVPAVHPRCVLRGCATPRECSSKSAYQPSIHVVFSAVVQHRANRHTPLARCRASTCHPKERRAPVFEGRGARATVARQGMRPTASLRQKNTADFAAPSPSPPNFFVDCEFVQAGRS
jgi:hypothetical protein